MNQPRPEPTRERWQPLRAGLIDLFYYDEEEFSFRSGNLLLRGNNGTGKSKVLALLLPFLLDGDVSPYRVEPDADSHKRMEWNLLLGGRHRHPERTGYSWLELGRRDLATGQAYYFTLGCGLKAVAGRPSVTTWFFTTDRRVGIDLALVDATRTALGHKRLAEVIGERGVVYDAAGRYRRAVDETLFGLGETRYEALVTLLIQLRQPQLSKRPNEKALSKALTEALPPLRQSVLHNVAEAFRALEEDRAELAAFQEAHTAAGTFLTHYRRYAAIAARRKARGPREAQYRHDEAGRALAAARAAREQAEHEAVTVVAALAEAEAATTRTRAQQQALRDSPRMREAEALHLAAEQAARAQAAGEQAGRETERARSVAADRAGRAQMATVAADAASAALAVSVQEAARAATAAGIEGEHAVAVAPLALPAGPAADAVEPAVRRASEAAGSAADRQAGAVRQLAGLVEWAQAAAQAHRAALGGRDDVVAQASEAQERRADAQHAADAAGTELVTATHRSLVEAVELTVPDLDGVLSALADWARVPQGPNPATGAVHDAARSAAAGLGNAQAQLLAEHQAVNAERGALTTERLVLERGEDRAPPPPYTRDSATRVDRPGTPLWRAVDFAADLSALERAGLEAALEAAGLLDAWLTPDGTLLEAGSNDVVVTAGPPLPVSLAGVLAPALDRSDPIAAALGDEVVAGVLAGIGLGPATGQTWVSVDGRFRVGVLEGSWHKQTAEYVGRGAREAARRARIAELTALIRELDDRLAALDADRDRLAARRRLLDREAAAVPSDRALAEAHALVGATSAEVQRLAERVRHADDRVREAAEVATAAGRERDETAAVLRLPTERGSLGAVGEAVGAYRTATAVLWPAVRRQAAAVQAVRQAHADADAADADATERAGAQAEADRHASAANARHQTLQASVGASVAELEQALTDAASRLSALEARSRQLAKDQLDRHGAAENARGREELLADRLTELAQDRSAAADGFRQFVAGGLLAIALPDLAVPPCDGPGWAPVPVARLARTVERELVQVDDADATWDRAHKQIYEQVSTLSATLSRHGDSAGATPSEDGLAVTVVFRGQQTGVPQLHAALETEVVDRERLLGAREREVLENHLINEVASELQGLISGAEQQAVQINAELAERRMSTGMQLRFVWRPAEDGPAGLAEARSRLLRQDADAWSAQDREAVGLFLQAQIAEVRAHDEGGTWLDHLTEALDYRRWHRFEVQRRQDGVWRPAYDRASGGERAMAASVPLFAAAASHYSSAPHPHAPRLVMLDEAFAGVDDDARAKCLGLLATFDLDVVMTSEREWGCYPTVPGLAIAQLSRREGVDAVLVTRWQWDGARRSRADLASTPLTLPDGRAAPPVEGSLWP